MTIDCTVAASAGADRSVHLERFEMARRRSPVRKTR